MFEQLITNHREWILEQWLERILSQYPAEGGRFLRQRQDRFANPVGHSLRSELTGVLEGIVGSPADDNVRSALDRIIRIRAVQEMPPSEAVGFVFELKSLVRQAADESDPDRPFDFDELDRRVDRLALAAFDVYADCREQISSIRVNEMRNRSVQVLERLNAWREARGAADEPEPVSSE